MLPLRLVIDTNVLISAALKPGGLQRTVLLLALTKPGRLYVSDAILAKYHEVPARTELQIRKGIRQQLLQLIKNGSHVIEPTHRSRRRATQMTISSWNAPIPPAPTISSPVRSMSSASRRQRRRERLRKCCRRYLQPFPGGRFP
jgi:PIN domain